MNRKNAHNYLKTIKTILQKIKNCFNVTAMCKRWKESNFENDLERIRHLLAAYDKILQYLLSQGACIAHIPAEFMLNFKDYATYNNITQFELNGVNLKMHLFNYVKISISKNVNLIIFLVYRVCIQFSQQAIVARSCFAILQMHRFKEGNFPGRMESCYHDK